MHEQVPVSVEFPDQVLAATPELLHPRARQLGGDQLRRRRLRPTKVTELDRRERAPLQMWGELAPDRLYFWKLGHTRTGS